MAFQFTQTGQEIQDILDLAQLQIAAPYDSASSYTAGDYCTKDDGFYVCTASTSGTWDGSKWSAVTVGDVLETAIANISSLNATLTQLFTSGTWTPTVSRASVASSSGAWRKIGDIVFLSCIISFDATQASSASLYIDGASLPSFVQNTNCTIGGSGASPTRSFSAATQNNRNVWLAEEGVGRFSAPDVAGITIWFELIAVPR